MVARAHLADPDSGHEARVNAAGELVVGRASPSTVVNVFMDTAATAYNLVRPVQGFRTVITSLILYGNKNVSTTTAAVVDVYGATSPDSTTVAEQLVQIPVANKAYPPALTDEVIAEKGQWINAKTTDDDVYVVLAYRLVPDSIDIPDFNAARGEDVT